MKGIALIASFAAFAFGGAAVAAPAALVLPASSNTATTDSANAPPPVPTPVAPADGAAGETLPAFAWSPVAGADRYEFQIAADAGFNAPVLGAGSDQFQTRNTRATLKSAVPNGRYWWRVRSVSAAGEVSAWSAPRSYEKAWNTPPALVSPTNGEPTVHPNPLHLTWQSVPRARNYVVAIATDPELASLVGGKTYETEATSFKGVVMLAEGRYYWAVTPQDSAGNRGARSAVGSFTWVWPSATTPGVTDLVSNLEFYDPQFSWGAVAGAVRYEVEVYSADQPDLKVCCTGTSIGTSLSPTVVFPDNEYFWRVRAIDAAGNRGQWNSGPTFVKSFDSVPPVTPTSIKNLRMRDNENDPGTDVNAGTPGYQTRVPVVTWDPVPGASSYEVNVTPFVENGSCNWTATQQWRNTTATTAWTPLGSSWNGVKPYANARSVSTDGSRSLQLDASYCVRVRARDVSSTTSGFVYGDYTYLTGGTTSPTDLATPAFQFVGSPVQPETEEEEDGFACRDAQLCVNGYIAGGDYVLPAKHEEARRMPLFTWKPLAGKQSYFVIVARDPQFHTLVDYAFTRVPAYAPRTSSSSVTYQDETTRYYWAVLPADQANGGGGAGDPLSAAPASFVKQSTAPTPLAPAVGADVVEPPTFHWSLAEGARRYRLQVATDDTFSAQSLIDNVTTDSTAYTASDAYPADAVLYWRVRGEDDTLQAFVWSDVRTFQKRFPAPVPAGNPAGGDFVPTLSWPHVPGALSYDIEVLQPDGTRRSFTNILAPAFTPSFVHGTGIWSWRVRAKFPKQAAGTVTSAWSPLVAFTRQIREPGGAETNATATHVVLSWQPKLSGPGNGINEYRVQVSLRPDFSATVENVRTELTSYAPLLSSSTYKRGGTFYWRVAAVDGGANTGDFTATQAFTLPAGDTAPPPPPPPPGKTASRITATVSKTARAVRVRGMVAPSHAGRRVTVAIFRKKGTRFVRLARKSPVLSRTSTYATSFSRPRRGSCKATVTFAGDTDHYRSSKTVLFRC